MIPRDWDTEVLRYDPGAGDKDRDGVKIIRDVIVTARKSGPCWHCGEDIVPGTRIRSETAVIDGRALSTSRTCNACCEAMATAWRDDGKAIEARITAMRERRGDFEGLPRANE